MSSFDLRKEKWIPVKTLTGENIEVSLIDALLKAREYKRIDDQSPLVVASLHRFLLAVLHRALKGPTDIKQNVDWFKNGFPEKEIIDYLDKWGDRFDLFHPKYPFYQVRELTLELHKKPWTVLDFQVNSDNNKVLFDHIMTNNPPYIDPYYAARVLISNQTFSLSAGRSPLQLPHTSTSPSAKSGMIVAFGEDLHQTLCYNLVEYKKEIYEIDMPNWEQNQLTIDKLRISNQKTISGICELYTCISRSIKLYPEHTGNSISIKWISYASGIKYKFPDTAKDPMVASIRHPKKGLVSLGLNNERGFWRDFQSLVEVDKKEIIPQTIENQSLIYEYTNKSDAPIRISILGQAAAEGARAVRIFYRAENFNIPLIILKNPEIKDMINNALNYSEEAFKKVQKATFELLVLTNHKLRTKKEKDIKILWNGVSNNDYRGKDQYILELRAVIQKLPSTITFWSTLESHFATFLSNFRTMTPEGNEKWWLEKLRDTVNESWQQTCESVGITGDSIKAIAMAEKTIRNHLNYLDKLIKGDDNV